MITVIQKPVAPGNWRATGHVPRDVKSLVIHIAEGSASEVDSWFNNPAAKVSAHFLVGLTGDLRQYVGIHDVAYHAGRVDRPSWPGLLPGLNPNTYTIGIEHEGDGVTPWPPAQLLTSTLLAAWLLHRFKLPVNEATITQHHKIYAPKTCPGPAFDQAGWQEKLTGLQRLFGDGVRGLIQGIR